MPSSPQSLLASLHLTEEDLQANRAGHMSATQRARLIKKETRNALAISALAGAAWVALAWIDASTTAQQTQVGIVELTLIGTGVAAILWYRALQLIRRSPQELTFTTTAGPVTVETQKNARGYTYLTARLNELPLLGLSPQTLASLASGAIYRIYTYQETIIALEPAGKSLTNAEELAIAKTQAWQHQRDQRFKGALVTAVIALPLVLLITSFFYFGR